MSAAYAMYVQSLSRLQSTGPSTETQYLRAAQAQTSSPSA